MKLIKSDNELSLKMDQLKGVISDARSEFATKSPDVREKFIMKVIQDHKAGQISLVKTALFSVIADPDVCESLLIKHIPGFVSLDSLLINESER